MPYQWIDPDLFLEHNGVAVYHCYDDSDSMTWYWYTTNPADCQVDEPITGESQFDIRDLSQAGLNMDDREQHRLIITQAIEAGRITGQPAQRERLPTVKIKVRGGIASVIEKPSGIQVKIVYHDTREKE